MSQGISASARPNGEFSANRNQETERQDQRVLPEQEGSRSREELSEPELRKLVTGLEEKLSEANERYLYLRAELENFKKRTATDRMQSMRFAAEPLARDLLEVIDNLERSLKHIPPETNPGLSDGLALTLGQFKAVLEKHGVKAIVTDNQAFNPHLHEAVGQAVSASPRGTILSEERRGYQIHDRLLRPSQVIVSAGHEDSAQELDDESEEPLTGGEEDCDLR